MTWQDKLTKRERAELDRAAAKRDKAKDEYNAVRAKLKNRADARLRVERKRKGNNDE